jgi:hypothetical protein
MRKSNVTDDEVGRVAWDTYSKAVGGKAYNGDLLPTWDAMCKDEKKENLVVAWKRAGRAVATLVEKKLPAPAPVVLATAPCSETPFTIAGPLAATGRWPNNPGPNLSSLPKVMPPSATRSLVKRTKCCGSFSLSLQTGRYVCPCGDYFESL